MSSLPEPFINPPRDDADESVEGEVEDEDMDKEEDEELSTQRGPCRASSLSCC